MATTKYKSPFQLLQASAEAVRRNLPFFIILNLITMLDVVWRMGVNVRDKTHGVEWGDILTDSLFGSSSYPVSESTALILIFVVLTILTSLMLVILSLRAAQIPKVAPMDVWEEFKAKGFRILLIELALVLLIGAGLLLLVLPGLYLIGRLVMAPYILVDQNTKVVEALNRSWELTKGKMWQVYNVLLFGILIALPNLVPIIGPPIALALAIAYSVALPLRYFEMKGAKNGQA